MCVLPLFSGKEVTIINDAWVRIKASPLFYKKNNKIEGTGRILVPTEIEFVVRFLVGMPTGSGDIDEGKSNTISKRSISGNAFNLGIFMEFSDVHSLLQSLDYL